MAPSRPAGPDGLAVVDKAAGWTSHDVVAKARGVLGTRKVGHSGTLDPDATGVLLLGVGRVTRLLRYLGLPAKRYTGVLVLGTATSTLDASGEVTGTWDMTGVGVAEVRAAATAFTGEILQVPPMVSAIQIDGRRLHELAREGIEVERAARPVTVHRFEVGAADGPGLLPDRGRLLLRHLHPVAGRRRGARAGRGRPPARAASHRDRVVHREQRRPGRGARPGPPAVPGGGAPRPAGGHRVRRRRR